MFFQYFILIFVIIFYKAMFYNTPFKRCFKFFSAGIADFLFENLSNGDLFSIKQVAMFYGFCPREVSIILGARASAGGSRCRQLEYG